MLRIILLTCLMVVPVFAQVPPGVPYQPDKHPNPIITYVTKSDFKSATYQEATDASRIELLSLSQTDGKRESIHVAETSTKKIRVGGRDMDVVLYPVVRQTFRLNDGTAFLLHSFKFPKTPFPPAMAAQILDELAFAKTKKPEESRFGTAQPPERLEIRNSEAFLFDQDGELTIFWTEDGVAHTATAKMGEDELFRLVEDLL
jgi:hypothetical protein